LTGQGVQKLFAGVSFQHYFRSGGYFSGHRPLFFSRIAAHDIQNETGYS
jgi:hypothetical protein